MILSVAQLFRNHGRIIGGNTEFDAGVGSLTGKATGFSPTVRAVACTVIVGFQIIQVYDDTTTIHTLGDGKPAHIRSLTPAWDR
jgi:hypothetical protein